jgi:hypothetical protein
MRTNLFRIVFFVLFSIFITWMSDLGSSPNILIDEIRMGYEGVIVDKILKRTTILKIKTNRGEIVEVGILCDEFENSAEIGDLIEKIPNENYVLLKKDSGVLKLPYLYINERMRSDRRWPKEWKDKWPESTYSF